MTDNIAQFETLACPQYVQIKITYVCNYCCPGCPQGHKSQLEKLFERSAKWMKYDEFKKIVDMLAPHGCVIGLTSWGESFLHKDIYKMISYASEKGLEVEVESNGSVIDPVRLAESGIARIVFSIDAFNEEAYRKYRKGGSFKKVLANLEKFSHEVDERGLSTEIIVKYLVNRYTEDDYAAAKEFYSSLPNVQFAADFFYPPPKDLLARYEDMSWMPLDEYLEWQPKKLVEYDPMLIDEEKGRAVNKASLHPVSGSCNDLFKTMYIDTNGDVYPCCMAFIPEPPYFDRFSQILHYGNILEEGLAVFQNEKINKLRSRFTKAKGNISPCDKCVSNKVYKPIRSIKDGMGADHEQCREFEKSRKDAI